MLEIALGISVVLNVALAIRCLVWKQGANGLVVYMKKKDTHHRQRKRRQSVSESFFTSRSEL